MSARERQEGRHGLRAASSIAALALALFAASCASVDFDRYGLSEASAARDDVASTLPPEQRKEHERLIAAYGGIYHAPELEALISHTVDRLVAASEKPELKYRVTLLNSSAINAFALPGGTLYITRGLVALANDTSELSSVLAHEMAHVIARHAAIREDQVRQAMIVSRVISDVVSDPISARWRSRKARFRWQASRAGKSWKPMPSASASRPGPATTPLGLPVS
jgi:predicted Zn-dependent protease